MIEFYLVQRLKTCTCILYINDANPMKKKKKNFDISI